MSEPVKPELKQCSRCHSTCTLEHYEKNRKGEWFKLCNSCRTKRRIHDATYRETHREEMNQYQQEYKRTYREKHNDDKQTCPRCNCQFRIVNWTLNKHMKTWSCYKAGLKTETTRKDFYQWVLDNRDNLLPGYKSLIPEAEEYFKEN